MVRVKGILRLMSVCTLIFGSGILAEEMVDDSVLWYDKTQAYMSSTVTQWVVGADEFFKTEDSLAQGTSSHVRLINEIGLDEESAMQYRIRLKARVRLPGFDERFHLFFSSTDDLDENLPVVEEKEYESGNDLSAFLRWTALADSNKNLDFDLGLRFKSGLHLYTRAKYGRYFWVTDERNFLFSQRVGHDTLDGWNESTVLQFEKTVSDASLFRWTNELYFAEKSDGLELWETVSLLHKLSEKSGLINQLRVEMTDRPKSTNTLRLIELSFRYRSRFHRKWLYYELVPYLRREPREYSGVNPGILFRLEFQLGEKAPNRQRNN